MSLLNIRNLATPITDKRNLVTIALIAALFGAVRLAGGKVEARPQGMRPRSELSDSLPSRKAVTKPKPVAPVEHTDPLFDEAIELGAPVSFDNEVRALDRSRHKAPPPPADLDFADEDPFSGAIKLDSAPPSRSNRAQVPSEKPGQRLDDIERSLGIR